MNLILHISWYYGLEEYKHTFYLKENNTIQQINIDINQIVRKHEPEFIYKTIEIEKSDFTFYELNDYQIKFLLKFKYFYKNTNISDIVFKGLYNYFQNLNKIIEFIDNKNDIIIIWHRNKITKDFILKKSHYEYFQVENTVNLVTSSLKDYFNFDKICENYFLFTKNNFIKLNDNFYLFGF